LAVEARLPAAAGGISFGNIFLQQHEPGVVFGVYETPDGRREFSYVLLLRHGIADDSVSVQSPKTVVSINNFIASMHEAITINGNAIEYDLEIQLKKDASAIASTKLTMNGKEMDPGKGMVFLVDLASDTVTYDQISANLPGDIPDLKENTTVTKLAREITQ
jgi:hypothetical protein